MICGSMFSGKTEELLRRYKRALIAKQKVLLVKPSLDVRFGSKIVQTHDQNAEEAIPIDHSAEILTLMQEYDVCAVDEAQFLDEELVQVCSDLANSGKRIILAGLDMDAFGKPFGPIPQLMCIAEDVTKLQAVCVQCGLPAHFTKRLDSSQEQMMLGAKENYEPRCRSCYSK